MMNMVSIQAIQVNYQVIILIGLDRQGCNGPSNIGCIHEEKKKKKFCDFTEKHFHRLRLDLPWNAEKEKRLSLEPNFCGTPQRCLNH